MKRPLKMGADGVLRDTFGRHFVLDEDILERRRNIQRRMDQDGKGRSLPQLPAVKVVPQLHRV